MSNINVNRTALPPEAVIDRPEYMQEWGNSEEFQSRLPAPAVKGSWRDLAVLVGVGGVGYVVVGAFLWLYTGGTCWIEPYGGACAFSRAALPWYLFGVPALATIATVGMVALRQYGTYLLSWSQALRQQFVRNGMGDPESLSELQSAGYLAIMDRFTERLRAEVQMAPYRELRGVDSYSPSMTRQYGKGDAATPALPAGPRVLSAEDVFARLNNNPDDDPHVFVYGASGSGKTTFARALLTGRDGELIILDPKTEGPQKWGGVPYVTVDVEGDFRPLRAAGKAVLRESLRRNTEGRRGNLDWPSLTVVIDEFFVSLAEVEELGRLLKLISSVGRSLRIRLVLMSQSNRVKSTGLEGLGDLRENLTTVLLGRWATDELPDAARHAISPKKAGVIFDGAEPVIINTRNVPSIAERPIRAQIWQPDGVEMLGNDRSFVRSFDEGDLLDSLLGTNERTNERPNGAKTTTLEQLRALRAAGISRERARIMGYAFTDSDWTRAGQELI